LFASEVRAQSFTAESIGAPGSGAAIVLYPARGKTRAPVVLLLHGCNGVSPNMHRWAQRVTNWGYHAAVVDSFRPRGLTNVCNQGRLVPAAARGADAVAAARLLLARPDVTPGQVAVVGFSHGAGGALAAAQSTGPFRASVAFYPYCPASAGLVTPTLILIGDADDWTPASRCVDFAGGQSGSVQLKVYAGAVHAFDSMAPRSSYFGHQVGADPQAREDAVARTRAFLRAHLN
jgi:dienelactone hydrolase